MTIIVIIILAAAVILTLSKNNPVESAREAKFKEDIRTFQDDLSLTIAKKYTNELDQWDEKINATSYNDIKAVIPSFTREYEGKIIVKKNQLMYDEDNVSEKEVAWFEELKIDVAPYFPSSWENSIASVTNDNVPIPKGFTYVTGTKDSGTVIQDSLGNEFVWIPATSENYVKDLTFPGSQLTDDDSLPSGITNEAADVIKYGGFYIARYEAGTPDGTETTKTNSEGVPLSKKDVVVWTNIDYTNAKKSAEKMISNSYVQTGLLTDKAWDRTCHYIEDYVTGYGTKQKSGFSDKWCVKNIYDLAGNVYEWTSNLGRGVHPALRGGTRITDGAVCCVAFRAADAVDTYSDTRGFRVRLYIK